MRHVQLRLIVTNINYQAPLNYELYVEEIVPRDFQYVWSRVNQILLANNLSLEIYESSRPTQAYQRYLKGGSF